MAIVSSVVTFLEESQHLSLRRPDHRGLPVVKPSTALPSTDNGCRPGDGRQTAAANLGVVRQHSRIPNHRAVSLSFGTGKTTAVLELDPRGILVARAGVGMPGAEIMGV